jgi:8-oxo-dGTP diphosphatase
LASIVSGGVALSKQLGLSVYGIIEDETGRCLLLKRSTESSNPGKWELPGGKVEQGESFEEALYREIQEETSLQVSIQHVVVVAESDLPKVKAIHLIFKVQVESGQIQLNHEHDEYVWNNLSHTNPTILIEWLKPFGRTQPICLSNQNQICSI